MRSGSVEIDNQRQVVLLIISVSGKLISLCNRIKFNLQLANNLTKKNSTAYSNCESKVFSQAEQAEILLVSSEDIGNTLLIENEGYETRYKHIPNTSQGLFTELKFHDLLTVLMMYADMVCSS